MRLISVILVISSCVKSVPIWNFSGPCFSASAPNADRYSVSLGIQPICEKIRTRKTPNTDTFHASSVARKFSVVRVKSVTSRIISVIIVISVTQVISVTWLILKTNKLLPAKEIGRCTY